MVDGQVTVKVREALHDYLLKELGLGPFAIISYIGQQIPILKENEVSGAINGAVSGLIRNEPASRTSRAHEMAFISALL